MNGSDFINLDAEHLDRTYSGFRSRANLSWKTGDDALLYYTWSQGFRAGDFNRGTDRGRGPIHRCRRAPAVPSAGDPHGGWTAPMDIAPDTLINNELGWKTMWLDRRIQWNGAIYQEDWNHPQIALFGLEVVSLGVETNGGDYRVRGVETSAIARVTNGLTIEAAAAWNHGELVKQATLVWADGTPINFATLKGANGQPFQNPGGALDSPLAGAPPFQGNIRARYELALTGFDAFAQLGAVHQSHSLASTDQLGIDLQGNSLAYNLAGFTTYDGALGVGRDEWLVQLYGENLTDTRAELYANYWQCYKGITVNRPRTIGLRLSFKFGGA